MRGCASGDEKLLQQAIGKENRCCFDMISLWGDNPEATLAAAGPPAPIIRIPASSVRDNAVFVVENGKAVRRSIESMKTTGNDMEIRKGLIGGEDLILDPPATLEDGSKVRVQSS